MGDDANEMTLWAGKLDEPGPLARWFGCMVSQEAMGQLATLETIMRVLEQVDAEMAKASRTGEGSEGAELRDARGHSH